MANMPGEKKDNQNIGWNVSGMVPPPYPYQTGVNTQPIPVIVGPPGVQFNPQHNAPDIEGQKEEIPDNFGESFSSTAIRHRFVRKVYTIVTSQLLVSLGIIALFTLHEPVKMFVIQHSWTIYLAYAVFLVTYIMLICCSDLRRKWPGNMLLLVIFTLAMSYLLGAVSSFYKIEIVFMSIGITTLICFLITMFAVQTKIDFTGCGVYLFVATCVLIIFGLMAIFMPSPTIRLLYSAGIVLLFSMYLIFDTQRIIGGRKHELSAEEHVTGALLLYIDVVNIFLGVLGLSRYS